MPKITFQNTGQSASCEPDGSLRDVVQNEGWPIPFGCENGICGTCLVTIGAGKEHLSPVEEIEDMTLQAMGMREDHRLACQCRVNGDVEIAQ